MNHRDPLTLRYRRTLRETTSHPWDYSEGKTEPPSLLVGVKSRPIFNTKRPSLLRRLFALIAH